MCRKFILLGGSAKNQSPFHFHRKNKINDIITLSTIQYIFLKNKINDIITLSTIQYIFLKNKINDIITFSTIQYIFLKNKINDIITLSTIQYIFFPTDLNFVKKIIIIIFFLQIFYVTFFCSKDIEYVYEKEQFGVCTRISLQHALCFSLTG